MSPTITEPGSGPAEEFAQYHLLVVPSKVHAAASVCGAVLKAHQLQLFFTQECGSSMPQLELLLLISTGGPESVFGMWHW